MSDYLTLFFFVFFFNLIPAFAPPTWVVLSRFSITDSLDPLTVLFVGVAAAVLGRTVMYFYSSFLYDFLPEKNKKKMEELRDAVREHKGNVGVLMFFYSLGPLPSNVVFIFSGLARLPLLPLLAGFFMGRLVSYSLGMFIFSSVINSLEGVGVHVLPYIDLVALALTLALVFVDWDKLLKFLRRSQQK